MDEPQVIYWLGRPIEEMSREELLDALRHCGREIAELHQRLRDWHRLAELTKGG